MTEQPKNEINHSQEDIEYKLSFTDNELIEIFNDETFNPEKLILLLEKQYPNTYDQGVGVWEGYDLKKHTLMVMGQFEKYFDNQELPLGVDKNTFRLILALHDIGKPEAIAMGEKHLQHEYTPKYIQLLFKRLGIDEQHTKLALVLTSGDPIGPYLMNKKNYLETKNVIAEMANKANLQIDEFFELLCIYYKVDAGSYTKNAGGLESLDKLFKFDEEKWKLNFSDDIQEKINKLLTS